MKQLLIFIVISLIISSCNTKTKDTAVIDFEEIQKDTIKPTRQIDTLMISRAFVLGKFDYKSDSTFVKVSPEFSTKEIYLNSQVYKAFLQMVDSANKDGIELKILSGTRNFNEQKAIWERKWKRYKDLKPIDRALKILEYSSMPSSSRHHWGTDMDLNSLNNSYFNSGKGFMAYEWLKTHANAFGFYQVYTDKENGRTGYSLEKWHWSYLPLANQYLEFYNSNITYEDINGFEGCQLAKELKIIDTYVNGISKKAKDYE
ncbi:M15 family metallopeptidase [Winogradskyella flava]|uniref:M15 family metallopeptidase n=1 Tax=Winogradskyella flava TaxID=1884876 RepID=UPI002491446A|nr:M15 family metallopeptidase [Winogradskyella flava]